MTYLKVTNSKDEIIFANIPDKYVTIFQNNKNSKHGKEMRSFYKETDSVKIWMVSKDKDLNVSSKIFNKTFSLYEGLINSFYENYSINLLSSVHTIATIQAKMSQKIEPFIANAKNGKQEERIKKTIEKLSDENINNSKIADLICHLSKRIEELDIHLKSLEVLNNKTITFIQNTPLKIALLNIYEPFKIAFTDKNIKVNFDRIDCCCKIKIDYRIFNLIMHHFFDNAIKYSIKGHSVDFIFSSSNELIIKMHSLTIENEKEVFKRGYSGKNVDNLAGDGIGMFLIKTGLKLMDMDIQINSYGELNNNSSYSKNNFIIKCVV